MANEYPFRIEFGSGPVSAKAEVRPFVAFLGLTITRACNFKCAHCLFEDGPPKHMSLKDIAFATKMAVNPFLNNILLFGGEPTVHPQFDLIPGLIVKLLGDFNRIPRAEDDPALKETMLQINNSLAAFMGKNLSGKEKERFSDSGELRNIYCRHHAQLPKGITNLRVTTNGHSLLASRENLVAGVRKMARMGIQEINISNDLAHHEYAEKANLGLDYSLIEGCNELLGPERLFHKIKKEFGEGIYVTLAGNGKYVLPIGRARNMPWEELLRLGSHPIICPISEIRQDLEEEYANWPNIESFSHCYCSVARHFRRLHQTEKYRPENAFHTWSPWIDGNMDVHLCQFQVLPPAGNLRRDSFDEIYGKILRNEMYRTVAEAGPQGLARQLTNLKEEQIRAKFLERTPCGMCEDLISGQLS